MAILQFVANGVTQGRVAQQLGMSEASLGRLLALHWSLGASLGGLGERGSAGAVA